MPCGQLRVMNFEFLPHPSFWGYGTLYVGTHAMRPQATGQIQMIRNTCYGFIAESYPPFLGRGWGRGFFMRPYIQGVPPSPTVVCGTPHRGAGGLSPCCNGTCSRMYCCVSSSLAPALFPPPRAPYCVEFICYSHITLRFPRHLIYCYTRYYFFKRDNDFGAQNNKTIK